MASNKQDAAARMMALFAGHGGAHGTHGEPRQEPGKIKWEIKTTARTIREPVTEELWAAHLDGKRPLGIVPIREDSTCFWGSIDIDEYDDSANLLDVIRKVESHNLPLVPCRSKSGGLHLFLFLSDPTPAGAVQSVLRDVAARLGLAGKEIFPKQTQVLQDRGDVGNWMVMPYYGSTYGGKLREQVGLKKTGAEMELSEFLRLAEKSRIGADALEKLASKKQSTQAPSARSKSPADFSDGPPCCEHLAAEGVEEHQGRNNALMHMGVYFLKAAPSQWKKLIEEANSKYMKPALGSEEVAQIIKSLERKKYEYTCKVEPMCSHCDSVLCRTRKFGVGDEGDLPIITGISKLDTTPPIWFVDVMGSRIEVNTDELQNYTLFQKACINTLNRCFGQMKQQTWVTIIGVALKNLTIIEAPDDVSFGGTFHELLEEYLTNRSLGDRREDLLANRPWEDTDGGRYYFRLKDLMRFLSREDMRNARGARIGRNEVSMHIKKLGGDYTQFNLQGKFTRVFWVPSQIIQKTPSLPPPPVPGVPI